MHFLAATQAPIVVTAGDWRLSIPLFTLRDTRDLAARLDADMLAKWLGQVAEEKRQEFLLYYRAPKSTINDVAVFMATPEGVEHVARTCIGRAMIIAEYDGASKRFVDLPSPRPLGDTNAAAIIEHNTIGVFAPLAKELASPPRGRQKEEEVSSADPLSPGVTASSPPTPATGDATSPSSPPPTPVATP